MSELLYIVKVVSEEGFRGTITGYSGPFATKAEADAYVDWSAGMCEDALIHFSVEELRPVSSAWRVSLTGENAT